MISYSIIIGDTIGTLIEGEPSQSTRALIILIFNTIFILPLCLLREMALLSWSSSVSILCDLALVFIICIYAPKSAEDQGITATSADEPYSFIRPTIFEGLGTVSFAFVCHHSSFIVRNSLENPSSYRWGLVTHISVGAALVFCVILGLAGETLKSLSFVIW